MIQASSRPCPQCEQTTALCKAITPFQKETPIPFGVTVTIPLNLEQRSSNKRNKWRGPAVGGEQAVYTGLMLERRVRFSSYRCSTAIKLSEEPKKNALFHTLPYPSCHCT